MPVDKLGQRSPDVAVGVHDQQSGSRQAPERMAQGPGGAQGNRLPRVLQLQRTAASPSEDRFQLVTPVAGAQHAARDPGSAELTQDVSRERLPGDFAKRLRQTAGNGPQPRAGAARQQHRFDAGRERHG